MGTVLNLILIFTNAIRLGIDCIWILKSFSFISVDCEATFLLLAWQMCGSRQQYALQKRVWLGVVACFFVTSMLLFKTAGTCSPEEGGHVFISKKKSVDGSGGIGSFQGYPVAESFLWCWNSKYGVMGLWWNQKKETDLVCFQFHFCFK